MHTPGPWTAIPSRTHAVKCTDIIGADGQSVAVVWAYGSLADLPVKANASLIVRSPELLASLRDIIDSAGTLECVHGHDTHDTPTGTFAAHHCPWCAARAAIARAEGQS